MYGTQDGDVACGAPTPTVPVIPRLPSIEAAPQPQASGLTRVRWCEPLPCKRPDRARFQLFNLRFRKPYGKECDGALAVCERFSYGVVPVVHHLYKVSLVLVPKLIPLLG